MIDLFKNDPLALDVWKSKYQFNHETKDGFLIE